MGGRGGSLGGKTIVPTKVGGSIKVNDIRTGHRVVLTTGKESKITGLGIGFQGKRVFKVSGIKNPVSSQYIRWIIKDGKKYMVD